MISLSEAELKSDEEITSLVAMDKEFFGILIRRYEERITRYIRRINGGTEEVVEDIVQNIFLKAYVHINSFRDNQKFSSWLYGVAHNECIDYWRKNKKHIANISLEANEKLFSILKSQENLGENIARKDEQAMFARSLGELPLKYREILILRFFEDRDYEEIAHILKKPASTVGTLIRRAKILFEAIINKKKNEYR
ncbi:MAG: RNA polymerase sigma factor [Parcubacteria group bacterium]|jgi:RNA polymerase sigma-70 factor (ECF subfamily)